MAGLRGQLQTESFVTGVLFVALEYFPGSPTVLVQQPGTRKFRYREIPTEPSSSEKARTAVTEVLTKLAAKMCRQLGEHLAHRHPRLFGGGRLGRNLAVSELAVAGLLDEVSRAAGEILQRHEQQTGYETLRLKLPPQPAIDGVLIRRRAVQNGLAATEAGDLLGVDADDDRYAVTLVPLARGAGCLRRSRSPRRGT